MLSLLSAPSWRTVINESYEVDGALVEDADSTTLERLIDRIQVNVR